MKKAAGWWLSFYQRTEAYFSQRHQLPVYISGQTLIRLHILFPVNFCQFLAKCCKHEI